MPRALLLCLLCLIPCFPARVACAQATTDARAPVSAAPIEVNVRASRREFTPGQTVRAKIQIRNRGREWLTLRQVTLGGEQTVSDLTGKNVGPGKTVSWSGDVTPEMLTDQELGPAQIRVHVETEVGNAEGKTDLARIDPFKVEMRYNPRPVSGGADSQEGDVRAFQMVITSRKPGVSEATVTVRIPDGWKLTRGKTTDTRTLRRAGETCRIGYTLLVPLAAPLGEYPLDATVTVDGRTYTARATIAVTR